MKRIPETNRFHVSNASDLVPNIQYTKNIDMDEEGYLKLSPPFPKLTGEAETANFDTVSDIINTGSGGSDTYKMVTNGNIFDIDLSALSITADAGAPLGDDKARFVGWKGGDWYINTSSDIYSLQTTAGTVWDIENTDSIDYAEVFVNRNTLVGASGSTLQQYLTTDMDGASPPSTNSSQTLTIPSNFAVTGLAYSNYRMGIATRNTTGGTAYFFTWDGATADAGQGIPVYANIILDIVAYKNSWAILTSAGQLLYFNGGGFDVLGTLPPYYFNANWIIYANSQDHGRTMYTDGEVIYFNLGSLLESSQDDSGVLQGFYSGAWCYDPLVGVYHRYGISNSKLFTASLNAAATVFTSVAHTLKTGDRVRFGSTTYFAIYVTDDTFKLADTYDLAVAGTATSNNVDGTKTWIKREDWAQLTAHNTKFGACIKFDNGTNLSDDGVLPFFVGLTVATKAMSSDNITCLMAPVFDNLGGITYQKIKSPNIEEEWQAIYVKHRVLTEGDKIIVKAKYRDFRPIAIGEAGDISSDVYITWTDSTTFTTTVDLTTVVAGYEVEFLSGAGAGSTAHVVSATNNAGTWTVVVDEEIRGGVSGNKSTCIFDSFMKLGTITKTNQTADNLYRAPVDKSSKWIQPKLELRGRDVAVEEIQVVEKGHKPSV